MADNPHTGVLYYIKAQAVRSAPAETEPVERNAFHSGQTYKDGKDAFAMKKGVSDYVLKTRYNDNGEAFHSYAAGQ